MAINKKRLKKILLYSLLSFLGLLVTAIILLFVFLDEIVESRMHDLLEKKFGNYYSLEFDEIEKEIGFSEMTFVVKNADFASDTTNFEGMEKYPILFFQADELRIEKLSTWDIIWGSEIDLDKIQLVRPDFKLYSRKDQKKQADDTKNKRGKGLLTHLAVNEFSLVEGRLQIFDFDAKKRILINDSINIRIDQVGLDLNKLDKFTDAFQCEDFYVDAYKSHLTPVQGLYQFSLDSLKLYGRDELLQLKNLNIDTKVSLKETSKLKINHSEVFNAFIEDLEIRGFNYDKLIYEDRIKIDEIDVIDADIAIFKNKTTYMEKTYRKEVLNRIFRKIKFPLTIDTVHLVNTHLEFELMKTHKKAPALIILDSLNGYLANFNTVHEEKDTLNIFMDSKFMDKGRLTLQSDIVIWDSINEYQKFTGNLRSMSFMVLNGLIQNFVNIKIHSGYLHRVDFAGYADAENSWGSVAFRYRDLGMTIYSFTDPMETKQNKFLSDVAKMAIHKTNPLPNGDLRTANFRYSKERWEGSIASWLGGILVGVFKTTLKDFVLDIIKNESNKKVQKALKEKAKKQKLADKQKLKEERLKKKEENKAARIKAFSEKKNKSK
jgi:hypothetical protein